MSNSSKCYEDLGCLDINEGWYGLTRPVNVLPQERHLIGTGFLLRTRDTFMHTAERLNVSDPDTILMSAFNASRLTKVIIHGFIDTGFVPWVTVREDKQHLNCLLSCGMA